MRLPPITPTVTARSPDSPPDSPSDSLPDDRDRRLHDAARAFEAAFLAEMLKSSGLGKTRGAFGGGAGEEQFASFLVTAQAEEMARAGGIGLAESIYQSLKERMNES